MAAPLQDLFLQVVKCRTTSLLNVRYSCKLRRGFPYLKTLALLLAQAAASGRMRGL
jgi:hypothetical protein